MTIESNNTDTDEMLCRRLDILVSAIGLRLQVVVVKGWGTLERDICLIVEMLCIENESQRKTQARRTSPIVQHHIACYSAR